MPRPSMYHLKEMVKANLKIRYRETWIGFLWVILNPISVYSAQAVVFVGLFHSLSNDYLLYLFTGLFPWFFLTQNIDMSCTYLKNNSSLLRNLSLKPTFLILSLTLENYFNFIFSTVITLLGLTIFSSASITFGFILLFYLASAFFFVFVFQLSLIASYAHVVFKDVKYIAHFAFTVLYFLTPTFYYLGSIPDRLQTFIKMNPLFWVFNIFRMSGVFPFPFQEIACFFSVLIVFGLISIAFTRRFHNRVYLKL